MTPIGKYEAQRVAQEKNLEDYRVARHRAEVAIARAKELKAACEIPARGEGCRVESPPHELRWPPQWDGKNPAVKEIRTSPGSPALVYISKQWDGEDQHDHDHEKKLWRARRVSEGLVAQCHAGAGIEDENEAKAPAVGVTNNEPGSPALLEVTLRWGEDDGHEDDGRGDDCPWRRHGWTETQFNKPNTHERT